MKPTTKPTAPKPSLHLDPRALHYFKAITASTTIEKGDILAATLASCALAGFEEGPTLELLAECRAWLSELGMTPRTRRA